MQKKNTAPDILDQRSDAGNAVPTPLLPPKCRAPLITRGGQFRVHPGVAGYTVLELLSLKSRARQRARHFEERWVPSS